MRLDFLLDVLPEEFLFRDRPDDAVMVEFSIAFAEQVAQPGARALILEGGSSMFYFTGVRWGLSERPFVCVLPARGEAAWVSPGYMVQDWLALLSIS